MGARWGPRRLAVLALVGAGIAAATWLLIFVQIPRLPIHGSGFGELLWANRLRALAFLGAPALGLSLDLWAERQFKAGFGADRWSEGELADVRRLVESPVWGFFAALALVGWLASVLVGHHLAWGGMAILLLQPLNVAGRLRQIVTPKVPYSVRWADWRSFQPIRSEHWGEGGV